MASVTLQALCLSLLSVLTTAYSPSLYYLDSECTYTLTVHRDLRMKLTMFPSSWLKRRWTCGVKVRTTVTGDRLLVQYRSMDTDYSANCRVSGLEILDSDFKTLLNGPNGNCGGLPFTTEYETSGNAVMLQFHTDNSFQYGQFDILVTSFTTGFNGTCPSSRYVCDNGRCISNSLECNGFNDCGDYSDEHCGLAGGVVAGIAVGVIVFFSLCVIFSIIGRRRRMRYRRMCEAQPYDTCHTTTKTYTSPPPTAYPGPGVQNPYPQPSYQGYQGR